MSGGEIALLNTLPALLADVDPLVVLAEDGPLVGRLRERGIAVRVVPLAGDVRDLRRASLLGILRLSAVVALARYVWTLRRLLREERADVVHTNSLKSALYGGVAGRLGGVPVLWHVRDRIADDYLPAYVVRIVRLAARILPTAIVANSQITLSTLPTARPGSVLRNPVVPDSTAVLAPAAVAPHAGFRVGVVGRLAAWKGQDVFLRAFAEAFPDDDGATATLIGSALFGEGDYAASLERLVVELGIAGRVTLRGQVDDVYAELQTLDVLVHCSTVPEPFGQVVLEGMATGLCVIASDEGGPSEIITGGVDGLLVRPRDPAVLAKALRQCREDADLRRRLGAAAMATAAHFSPERTAADLLQVYRSLT